MANSVANQTEAWASSLTKLEQETVELVTDLRDNGNLHSFVPGEARHLAQETWALQPVRSSRIELPEGTVAARAARGAVDLHLGPGLSAQEAMDLRLLVSELVSNAVVHGGGTAVMYLALTERRLRVEVCDSGPEAESPAHAASSGFGLAILDRLAARWGVSTDDGTCVWFEIDRAPRTSDSA